MNRAPTIRPHKICPVIPRLLSSAHEASARVVAAIFALCAHRYFVGAVLGHNAAPRIVRGLHVARGAGIGTGDNSESAPDEDMRDAVVVAARDEVVCDRREPERVCIGS